MPAEGNLPVVAMETDKGKIVLELYKNDAPGTVDNFEKLVKKGFYNGIKFHRVIPGFMIQGGDPKGNGTGDAGYKIKCEIDNNRRRHQRGSLSMAHAGRDTGSCQFFICHVPTPHLDGKHTVFGQVIEGIEVVDKIQMGDKMKKVYMIKE